MIRKLQREQDDVDLSCYYPVGIVVKREVSCNSQCMLENYNIEIIQQSACSPEVNALDLGIWMSVQSHVERRHWERRWDPDGLAVSTIEAWQNLPENPIRRVFNRISIVLQLIVECGGDNINVEERRGRHGAAVLAAPLPEWKKYYERRSSLKLLMVNDGSETLTACESDGTKHSTKLNSTRISNVRLHTVNNFSVGMYCWYVRNMSYVTPGCRNSLHPRRKVLP